MRRWRDALRLCLAAGGVGSSNLLISTKAKHPKGCFCFGAGNGYKLLIAEKSNGNGGGGERPECGMMRAGSQ